MRREEPGDILEDDEPRSVSSNKIKENDAKAGSVATEESFP
jgi:hypothetical protein